ncbi:MAG: hypothetical protein V4447_10800 [Pseudomonadota bacterium]
MRSNQDEPIESNKECCADGCPMHASLNPSTSGGSGWVCIFHFGKDKTQWARITGELHRLSYIVKCMRLIRATHGTPKWIEVAKDCQKELRVNQKSDLINKPKETAKQWAERLEKELSTACLPQEQAPIQGM